MSVIADIFAGRSEIDFRPKWKISLIVSACLVVLSIALVLLRGLNLSIDFEGGTIWKVPADQAETQLEVADVRALRSELADSKIQEVFSADGSLEEISVQVSTDVTNTGEIRSALSEAFGLSSDDIAQDSIGPTWGDQITNSARNALIFFVIAVAAYLAWTLEGKMAVAALSAVLHDLIITAGVYAATGLEVSPATVIALLTILGYSLYDTVVVFDKIKENESSRLVNFSGYDEMVSYSMNQVVMRSINTTITTVLPVLSMLVVGALILGASSLASFAVALFIGLILGTYSSIFFASPILVWLREKFPGEGTSVEVERKRAEKRAKVATGGDIASRAGMIAPKARKTKKR